MVEAHLSEIYILGERVKKYLQKLARQYRNDVRSPAIKGLCKNLGDMFEHSLEAVVAVRGDHVHRMRFSDPGIDRLRTLDLLSLSSNARFASHIKEYHREVHKEIRKNWRPKIEANNKASRKLLDSLFGDLYPVVFDEKTCLLRPPERGFF